MSNEQLAIMLLNIIARLEKATFIADEKLLIHKVTRHKESKYIGKNLIPPIQTKKEGKDWVLIDGDVVALDEIRNVIDDIKEQADILVEVLLKTET